MDNLSKCRDRNMADPSLVMVFDEASSLFYTEHKVASDPGRYIAFNRIFSCLRKFPLWFFILSTESKIEKLLPPENPAKQPKDERSGYNTVNSGRRADVKNPERLLRVFSPFVALPLDIEDKSRMRDPAKRQVELAKSMIEFSKPEHMAMFGRPLWFAYKKPDNMYAVAKLKLVVELLLKKS